MTATVLRGDARRLPLEDRSLFAVEPGAECFPCGDVVLAPCDSSPSQIARAQERDRCVKSVYLSGEVWPDRVVESEYALGADDHVGAWRPTDVAGIALLVERHLGLVEDASDFAQDAVVRVVDGEAKVGFGAVSAMGERERSFPVDDAREPGCVGGWDLERRRCQASCDDAFPLAAGVFTVDAAHGAVASVAVCPDDRGCA